MELKAGIRTKGRTRPPALKLRRASCEARQREAGWSWLEDSNLSLAVHSRALYPLELNQEKVPAREARQREAGWSRELDFNQPEAGLQPAA